MMIDRRQKTRYATLLHGFRVMPRASSAARDRGLCSPSGEPRARIQSKEKGESEHTKVQRHPPRLPPKRPVEATGGGNGRRVSLRFAGVLPGSSLLRIENR